MVRDLVSVIIPVYNTKKHLCRCIDSVLEQSYTSLEIIIIDDGSSDGSGDICDEYAAKDERINVVHKQNGGVADARNVGIELSKGEFIVFIDSDDYIERDYIKTFYDNRNGVDMVVSDAKYMRSSGVFDEFNRHDDIITIDFNDDYDCSKPYSHYTVWGTFIRREIIGDLKFSTDLCIGEDTLFYFSLLKRCGRIRHIPQNLYCYMIYENSAVHGVYTKKRLCELTAWERVIRLFDDMPKLRQKCIVQYMVRCMEAYEQIYFTNSDIAYMSSDIRKKIIDNRIMLKGCTLHTYFKVKLYMLTYCKPLFDLYIRFKKVGLK